MDPKTMELVTSAFKIVIDERYKEIKEKESQIQAIISEFEKSTDKKETLLNSYNIFSGIIVKYWQDLGQEIACHIFDLLFKEWDLFPRVVIPINLRNDYFYNPEEDY